MSRMDFKVKKDEFNMDVKQASINHKYLEVMTLQFSEDDEYTPG